MPPSIAFLHTSPVHVATFTSLLERLRPGTVATHVVDEELLRLARDRGHDDPETVQRVQAAVLAAAASGATVIACTCSTVGAAAEATPSDGSFAAIRIDRAMADEAVRMGPAVLVVAALESTLAPTVELIRDSARRLNLSVTIECALAEGAWRHFEQGNMAAYLAAVQDAVRGAVPGPSVVVLAQASMAPAAANLRDIKVAVLSSPELGARAVLARAEA